MFSALIIGGYDKSKRSGEFHKEIEENEEKFLKYFQKQSEKEGSIFVHLKALQRYINLRQMNGTNLLIYHLNNFHFDPIIIFIYQRLCLPNIKSVLEECFLFGRLKKS